jgi:hypothetical protein
MTAPQRLACLVFLLAAGLSLAACGGSSSKTTPEQVGDFSLSASPNSVSLTQGASSPLSVTVSAVHGLTGSVNVAISGLPAGVTSSPQFPLSAAVGSTVSVTLSAAKTANLGPSLLSFQGTQGSLSHSASAALNVGPFPDFGIAIQPGSVALTQGAASKPVSVVVTPLNAFSGNVSVSIAGLPAGISASTGNQFKISAGSAQVITFAAASSAAPGTAGLTLQGTSGSLSHSASAALQVQAAVAPDFSLAVKPGLVAITQGQQSRPVSISAAGLNGFSGDVTVSISGLPAGVTASPSSLTISAGSSQSVTFFVPTSTKPQSAILTFTGTGGSITHSVTSNMQTLLTPCTGTDCAEQGSDPVFSLTYFATTAVFPLDETIHIVNPGIQSIPSSTPDLCANIYVFDANQELSECCSCDVTANATLTLSVSNNLASNPGNGVGAASGTIAVIPGTVPESGFCDPTNPNPAPDLEVWGTHVDSPGVNRSGAANAAVVETRSADLTLTGGEETDLALLCAFIEVNDSGTGICSCTEGAGSDAKRALAQK